MCVQQCSQPERHLGDDLVPANMEPVAQGGRVASEGTRRARSPEPPPVPLPLPAVLPGPLTFSFLLGNTRCQCPARWMMSRGPCSSVGVTPASMPCPPGPRSLLVLCLGGGGWWGPLLAGWGLLSPLTLGRRPGRGAEHAPVRLLSSCTARLSLLEKSKKSVHFWVLLGARGAFSASGGS